MANKMFTGFPVKGGTLQGLAKEVDDISKAIWNLQGEISREANGRGEIGGLKAEFATLLRRLNATYMMWNQLRPNYAWTNPQILDTVFPKALKFMRAAVSFYLLHSKGAQADSDNLRRTQAASERARLGISNLASAFAHLYKVVKRNTINK